MIESIINGKTLAFLRRALPFDLKAVAVTEVSYSLEETIEASGMELQPGIAGQLAEATQGYPFMIQLVGYYAWQLARRAHTDDYWRRKPSVALQRHANASAPW